MLSPAGEGTPDFYFQVTGMIEGFLGFEIFNSGFFWVGIFWVA